jgi:phytoene dehydrogenase-like protein
MAAAFDAVVVGAGPNGLAAALRLARGGRKVVVLERSAAIGGLSAAREFHPGYTAPGILHDDGLLSPRVVARLGLDRHGLAFRDAPPVLLAEPGGPGLLLPRDPHDRRGASELAARSAHDAAAYVRYRALFARLAPLVDRLMTTPPPPLSPHSTGEMWEVVRAGLGVWRLGRRETLELMRVAPMCVADFLNESFETPLLVEGLAAPAVVATWAGPWSAGTTTNLLLRESAPGRLVAGGPPALVAALASAARAAGVARLRVEKERVRGVLLAGGEAIDAVLVVATCDPKRTLLTLLAPGTLPIVNEEEARRIRSRGTAAKIHLALSGPLPLAGRPSEGSATCEAIRIGGGHVDELERAFDAVKYRRISRQPQLEIRVPTVGDPKLAPAGHHVLSIVAGFAPYALEGGWNDARRDELLEAVLTQLERHAPGARARVVASEVLDPARLEAELSLTGGQLHHVEPALDQLLALRPSAGTARYATAVAGLFLGGSGSHGGGGVTCAAGLLAAEAALAARPGASAP